MVKKFPIHPKHPERICWGCDKYCPADSLMCGNGSVATLHPSELFGEDWMSWGLDAPKPDPPTPPEAADWVGSRRVMDHATGIDGMGMVAATMVDTHP